MAVTNLYTLIKLFKTPVGTENELSSLPLSMIEIPIIQRDYAQGRNIPEVNRIRKRFLFCVIYCFSRKQTIKT